MWTLNEYGYICTLTKEGGFGLEKKINKSLLGNIEIFCTSYEPMCKKVNPCCFWIQWNFAI